MVINNETVGISAEVAIAKEFNVRVNPDYASRANGNIVEYIRPCVRRIFSDYKIAVPIRHIAEKQNPIDFILTDNKSLSVKSNKGNIGKVAPQILGQPTDKTYFELIKEELNYDIDLELKKNNLSDTYKNRSKLFKQLSIGEVDRIINIYWKYMFHCDYLIHFYNIISKTGVFLGEPRFKVFSKNANMPYWDVSKFSFSQSLESWNESCTLKYMGYSIGEFQVHNNRNCFKFRFNMDNIVYLMDNNLI